MPPTLNSLRKPSDHALSQKERRRGFRRSWLRRSLLPALSRPFLVSTATVLILSPHQDDETLGCGGLIALKRQQGIPVTVAFVTDGGQYKGDLPADKRAAVCAIRRKEAFAALGILGVPETAVHFLDFPDGGLSGLSGVQQAHLRSTIHGLIQQCQPGEIYVPHRHDSHPDHEATYSLVREVLSQVPTTITVYEYLVWMIWSRNRLFSSLRWSDLQRGYRLSTLDVQEKKQQAMKEYHSQLASLPVGFVEHLLDGNEFYFCSRSERVTTPR